MESTKQWYESRTIWGALISVVSGLVPVVGSVMAVPEIQSQVVDVLSGMGAAVGGAIATWGRVQAQAAIAARK